MRSALIRRSTAATTGRRQLRHVAPAGAATVAVRSVRVTSPAAGRRRGRATLPGQHSRASRCTGSPCSLTPPDNPATTTRRPAGRPGRPGEHTVQGEIAEPTLLRRRSRARRGRPPSPGRQPARRRPARRESRCSGPRAVRSARPARRPAHRPWHTHPPAETGSPSAPGTPSAGACDREPAAAPPAAWPTGSISAAQPTTAAGTGTGTARRDLWHRTQSSGQLHTGRASRQRRHRATARGDGQPGVHRAGRAPAVACTPTRPTRSAPAATRVGVSPSGRCPVQCRSPVPTSTMPRRAGPARTPGRSAAWRGRPLNLQRVGSAGGRGHGGRRARPADQWSTGADAHRGPTGTTVGSAPAKVTCRATPEPRPTPVGDRAHPCERSPRGARRGTGPRGAAGP